MPATPFDSALTHRLVPTGETARLFSDTAEVRAMMLTLGTLAQAQADAGLIPEIAAKAIHRAGLEIQIDPGGLAAETAQHGTITPALVAAFGKEMQAPEFAQYLCHDTAPEDIQDTALMLRLRQAIGHAEAQLREAVTALATLAETSTEDTAQTASGHGTRLLALLDSAPRDLLWVCLSADKAALRAALAEKLALRDPGQAWGAERIALRTIAQWFADCAEAAGQMAPQDGALHSATVIALAHHVRALNNSLTDSPAARMTEALTLPQIILSTLAALHHAPALAKAPATTDPADVTAFLTAVKGL